MNSEWAEDQIEAFVDGSLTREDRRAFERACAADPALRASVQEARNLRDSLRAMSTPACPPDVTKAILAGVRREMKASRPSRAHDALVFGSALWRPALVAIAVLAFALVLTRPSVDPPEPVYAQAEVDMALEEVKWTLAYLNGVGSRTGATIRSEVFGEGVVRPIERGLGLQPTAHRARTPDS